MEKQYEIIRQQNKHYIIIDNFYDVIHYDVIMNDVTVHKQHTIPTYTIQYQHTQNNTNIHNTIPYSRFLSREKTFANFAFVAIRKSFLSENLFQAIHESFLPRKKPAVQYIYAIKRVMSMATHTYIILYMYAYTQTQYARTGQHQMPSDEADQQYMARDFHTN